MIVVKKNILSYLKKPIHQSWFGQNKTWRGFVVMPLLTWPGVVLAQWLENLVDPSSQLMILRSSGLIAVLLGMGYCLAELPNSFLKRRLGIKEGLVAQKNKWAFILLDQADSAFGCLLAYKILLPISWRLFWETIIFGTLLHLIINRSLYIVGVRKNPY
jgi:CDP-diacylglycerol--serine O-phosphatidyltransferase